VGLVRDTARLSREAAVGDVSKLSPCLCELQAIASRAMELLRAEQLLLPAALGCGAVPEEVEMSPSWVQQWFDRILGVRVGAGQKQPLAFTM